MARLALSAKLFAGKIIYIAVEASGTSDIATRPASNSAAWLELAGVFEAVEKPQLVTEIYDEIGPDGWETGKDEYTTAQVFEIATRYTTALYEQLRYGLAGAIVQGTAQTPYVNKNRVLSGWVNFQERNGGQDRLVMSLWCEIRAMEPPASAKKTQEPKFELWVKRSTLNSINFPA
jgi:hypothetical protein